LTIAPNTNSSSKDRAYRKDFLTNQLVEIIEKNVSGLN
jgi:hypothetical protein